VGIKRPALFGLGAGGIQGVERVFEILEDETATAMRLLGVEGGGLRSQPCQYKSSRKGSLGWARRLTRAGGSDEGAFGEGEVVIGEFMRA